MKGNINFKNGTTAEYNADLSLLDIKFGQDNGIISKRFITSISKFAGSNKDSLIEDFSNIDDSEITGATYLAYRKANKDGYSYEEFLENVCVDLEVFATAYMYAVAGKYLSENKMADEFKKVTPLNNSKKKKRKHRK